MRGPAARPEARDRQPAWDPLRRTAARRPRKVALETGSGRRWRWAELDAAADRLAEVLRAAGAAPGRAVAVLAPPGPLAVTALHAVPRTGAVVAFVGERWSGPELVAFLDGVRPAAVLRQEDGRWPERVAPGAVVRLEVADVPALLHRTAASGGEAVPALEGAHSLLWTSGTAGDRRGVILTAENHRAVTAGAAARLALGSDDRWLATLAPAHVGGLALLLRAAATGATLVTTGRFEADRLLRLAAEGRVTHASLVPAMLRRLLDASGGLPLPSGLRCLLVGGASTPPDLLERALEVEAPVALTYGLTEAASQVATAQPGLVRRKPGTAGLPLEGVELRVAGPEPRGASPGAAGEILVRGPTVSPSRLGPQGRRVLLADAEGWLPTGDLGRLDEEGHLWVTGRLDDRLVSGGVTVDPAEVEAALAEHPGLAEVAVVGVPDAEWGQRVAAAAVPARGSPPPEEELEAWVRARLSPARRPRSWRWVGNLPRNRNGKVDRDAVRRLFAGDGATAC